MEVVLGSILVLGPYEFQWQALHRLFTWKISVRCEQHALPRLLQRHLLRRRPGMNILTPWHSDH